MAKVYVNCLSLWLFLSLISFWQITSGMVISTFVSAPIMYVSAWLLTFPTMDPKPLAYAIQNVSFDISIISLVSLVSMIQYKNEWKSHSESENSLVIESYGIKT